MQEIAIELIYLLEETFKSRQHDGTCGTTHQVDVHVAEGQNLKQPKIA